MWSSLTTPSRDAAAGSPVQPGINFHLLNADERTQTPDSGFILKETIDLYVCRGNKRFNLTGIAGKDASTLSFLLITLAASRSPTDRTTD